MRKLFMFISWVLIVEKATCQIIDNPTSNYQTNKAAEIVADYQISKDLYNGLLNYSLPIYSNKESNTNISISYQAGGIKPDQLPNIMGIGWNLNVGGIITRAVNNQPDEYKPISTWRWDLGGAT